MEAVPTLGRWILAAAIVGAIVFVPRFLYLRRRPLPRRQAIGAAAADAVAVAAVIVANEVARTPRTSFDDLGIQAVDLPRLVVAGAIVLVVMTVRERVYKSLPTPVQRPSTPARWVRPLSIVLWGLIGCLIASLVIGNVTFLGIAIVGFALILSAGLIYEWVFDPRTR
jgi:hypothetical protein